MFKQKKKIFLRTLVITFAMIMTFLLSGMTVRAVESSGSRSPMFVSSQEYTALRGVWVNKPYAMTSNNVYTSAAMTNTIEYTQWLKAGNFGFSIPAEATIVGVEANVERKQQITENVPGTTKGVYDFMACLLINGTIVTGSNVVADATPYYWPTTEETKTFGGPDNLWGQSLTPADINNGNFGFAILPRKAYLPYAYPYVTAYPWVDYMSMTVFYTMPAQGDTIPPVIAAHANITAEATSNLGAVVTYSPTATDNVDPTVNVVSTPASGSQFPLGTTTVTNNATDAAGNAATPVTFDVTVQDTTAPVITINETDPYNVAYGSTYTDPGATWVDAVDGTGNAVIGGDIVDTQVPGQYTVTYNYTDAAGNAATEVTRTVTVLPWSTINIATDVLNWKGKPTSDNHIFNVQINGADTRNVSETATVTYDRLSPGTYTITQSADSKYTLHQIIGDNDNDAANGAAITVGSGETVNLTFVDWVFQPNKK